MEFIAAIYGHRAERYERGLAVTVFKWRRLCV